jgi:hypothetical protein
MHGDFMRTTLTIDSDVAERIRQETQTGKRSLKDVINDRLRAGFGMQPRVDRPPFTVEPHTSSYQPGFDTGKLNPFLDDLEADACRDRLGGR